jgi:hypothetical protein
VHTYNNADVRPPAHGALRTTQIAAIISAAEAAGLHPELVVSLRDGSVREVHLYGEGRCVGSIMRCHASGKWSAWAAPYIGGGRWRTASATRFERLPDAISRLSEAAGVGSEKSSGAPQKMQSATASFQARLGSSPNLAPPAASSVRSGV